MSPHLGNAPSMAQGNATIQETTGDEPSIHATDASSWSAHRTAILDKDGATAQDTYVQLRESLRKGAPVASLTGSQIAVKVGFFAPWVARHGATIQDVDLLLLAVETAT